MSSTTASFKFGFSIREGDLSVGDPKRWLSDSHDLLTFHRVGRLYLCQR